MPKLLSMDFYKSLKEVTTSKVVQKGGKFDKNGLYSEQIFGPIKSYTCHCKFHGSSKYGSKCPICGIDIIDSSERRIRFAKIVLPMYVLNPIIYDILIAISGSKLKNMVQKLLNCDTSILYKYEEKYFVETENHEDIIYDKKFEKLEAVKELVLNTSIIEAEKGNTKWNFIKDNIDKLIINEIIVLPPDLRPITKTSNGSFYTDKINKYYIKLLIKKEIAERSSIRIEDLDKKIWYQYFKIQKIVDQLYEKILNNMSKKEGLIRGNILGKRIDFSGRAVIVPEPSLNLDECIIPYLMFLELFKIQIAKKLLEFCYFKILSTAIEYVDNCLKEKSSSLFKISEIVAKDEVCLLNRQPSLHRLSILGFKLKISLDNVIKIHPLVCSCFNADFDGDQMAIYIPISTESKDEVLNKFLVTKNLFDPANGNLTTLPSQDIVLGIFLLSSGKINGLDEVVTYKNVKINRYMKIINDMFPIDYKVINCIVDKKKLLEILNDIKEKYDQETTRETLDKVKNIGLQFSTLFGSTMSIDKFILGNKDELINYIYSDSNIKSSLDKIQSKTINDELRKSFNYSYVIDSGSRGSWDQARQIILSRGFVSNFKGQILETYIKSNLIDGLNEREFFTSTYGTRKGLLDTALNTGVSGYLSRKLIFSCVNLQKGKEDDCGTTDFLTIQVTSKKKAQMLQYRYFLDETENKLKLITKDNYNSIIGQTIKLRSPVFCKNYNICNKCYGELWKITGKFIGVISAQCLGSQSTQLVLRTFHSSGTAISKKESTNMSQDDVVADLSSVSNILHRFPKDYPEMINDLFEIYNKNGSIFHVHFEVLMAQLMWKDFTKWRMLEDRDNQTYTFYSIQKVPTYESWILGLGFSNPKIHIIKGLLSLSDNCYSGILDRFLTGSKIKIKD